MAQHDYNIANQTFPNTRTDINNALSAVASNNSGTAAPSTTFANQWFYETDTNLLQIRNEDNDAYITIAELDQTNDTVEYFKSDSIRTALIEFTDGDDAISIADGGGITISTSLDMNGTELILDADADSSITADTDDQIDFKIGGTDVVKITSATLDVTGAGNTGGIININSSDTAGASTDNIGRINFVGSDSSGGASGTRAAIETEVTGNFGSTQLNLEVASGGASASKVAVFHPLGFTLDAGKIATFGESAPDASDGGITLQQGSNDGMIMTFKSTDVSHGMSGATEVDNFGQLGKATGNDGGFRIMGFCDGSADVMQIMGFGATAQTTDTTGSGAMVELFGAKKSGTGIADLASNENLVAFRQFGGTTRFIMKSDGTVHASDTSWATSLDTYDDAQLCRSMDMLPAESTREGFISDKWTEMVKYNINDLVDAGIYTKDGKDMIEKGETPFFRVQPLLRLHNGAIWQNYTKHQKLAEAVYEMAKETLGENKANEILKKHDIKLLN